jgi:hypothetical protein
MREVRPIPSPGDWAKRPFDKRRSERPVQGHPSDGVQGRREAPAAAPEQRRDVPETLDVRA